VAENCDQLTVEQRCSGKFWIGSESLIASHRPGGGGQLLKEIRILLMTSEFVRPCSSPTEAPKDLLWDRMEIRSALRVHRVGNEEDENSECLMKT
jgi:hypothetical protein